MNLIERKSDLYQLLAANASPDVRDNLLNDTDNGVLGSLAYYNYSLSLDKVIRDPKSDAWNLSEMRVEKNRACIVHFERCDPCFKDTVKCYVVFSILSGRNVASIVTMIKLLLNVLNELVSMNGGIPSLELFTYVQVMSIAEKSCPKGRILADYLKFVHFFAGVEFSFDIAKFDMERNKLHKNSDRTPVIPPEYFKRIIEVADQVMRDEDKPVDHRMMACSILILSQIAPRVGEFTTMKIDALSKKNIPGLGDRYYISFDTYKRCRGGRQSAKTTVVCNSIAKEAFENLLELRKQNRLHDKLDYLYMPVKNRQETYPVKGDHFKGRFNYFFYTYLNEECSRDWPDIARIKVDQKPGTYAIPHIHSFRVNVATELVYNKVGMDYIRQHLSHLTLEATQGYARAPGLTTKDPEYVYNVLKSVAEDETKLLGVNGEAVATSIRAFLKDNNIRVVDMPVSELRQLFSGKLFLSPKDGGLCCIKVGDEKAACNSERTGIGRMACATNICPNLYRLYYHVPVSLNDFRLSRDAEKDALRNGLTAAAMNEHSKAVRCRAYVLEELEELSSQLRKHGQKVVTDHPELKDIVDNIQQIKKEVQGWN